MDMNTPMIVQNRKLTELTSTLACLLGKDWSFTPRLDGDGLPFRLQHIAHKDGYSVGVCFGQYPLKNRIVIDGDYPRDAAGNYINPRGARLEEGEASISVSADREPAAIVKEIERRLLPIYVPQWHACMAVVSANNDYETRKQATIAEVAAAGVEFVKHNREEGYIALRNYETSGSVRVNSPTSLEVNIRGLNVEQLKAILAVIRPK
jgi:hypothetical protein